ncbi:hypothetical protein [Niallia taxi]|uniref:hypothetical protein n=1 Tax=Niallia taxi TaxID=2499688 RepID=UPI002E1CD5B3|nr:hypothetical protein [Niallia taxi]
MVYSKGQSIEIKTKGQTYYAIVDIDNINEGEIINKMKIYQLYRQLMAVIY